MKRQKHYIVLNNGKRIKYPAPEAWEYVEDTNMIKRKTSKNDRTTNN